MFSVNIKREDEEITYFVYDEGEIIQTTAYLPSSFISTDNRKFKLESVVGGDKHLSYVFKNPTPAIIRKEDIEKYTQKFYEQLNSYTKEGIGFMPITSIKKQDYEMLKALSEHQNENKEETKKEKMINQDIDNAWQYIRTINPNYGYRTY